MPSLQSIGQPPVKQSRTSKPLLFSHFKNELEIPAFAVQRILLLNAEDTFSIKLSDLLISGLVTEKKITGSDSTISINLRLQNFNDALFNIVFFKNNYNIPVIRGRIIHPAFGDVFILESENGKYYLRKQEQRLLLTE